MSVDVWSARLIEGMARLAIVRHEAATTTERIANPEDWRATNTPARSGAAAPSAVDVVMAALVTRPTITSGVRRVISVTALAFRAGTKMALVPKATMATHTLGDQYMTMALAAKVPVVRQNNLPVGTRRTIHRDIKDPKSMETPTLASISPMMAVATPWRCRLKVRINIVVVMHKLTSVATEKSVRIVLSVKRWDQPAVKVRSLLGAESCWCVVSVCLEG